MAATPDPTRNLNRIRLRRWLVGIAILLALLAAYAVALRWVTERIGDDVENTLRAAPVLDDHTPRLN